MSYHKEVMNAAFKYKWTYTKLTTFLQENRRKPVEIARRNLRREIKHAEIME